MTEPFDFRRLLVDGALTQLAGWEGRNLHWAWEVMNALVRDAPEIAWPILLEIVERGDDRQLAYLGAGDLEDFLVNHGRKYIDRVEEHARDHPKFRIALGSVWQNAIPNDVWARVQAVADDGSGEERDRTQPDDRVELDVVGLPPGSPGSVAEDIERKAALLKALREATERGPFRVIDGPAAVEIRLEPGSTTDATFAPTVVAAAILETISVDRPAIPGLETFDGVAAIRSPELVWDLGYSRIRARDDGYRVEVRAMADGQVEAFDDGEEPAIGTADVDALLEGIEDPEQREWYKMAILKLDERP